jgi:signal transduction histidine kinase
MTQKLVWLIIIIVTSGMLILVVLREFRTRNLWKIESLKQLDESRKILLSSVSHDLKNPLSSLLMANELLLKTLPKDSENSERRRKLLVRSHIAAEQMRQLITDLLDSSSIEAGKLQINPITCSAEEIISHALEVLEPIATEKGIEVQVHFPKDLPPLFADPERAGQIFSNLIGNAIKFTPSLGKIFVTAKVTGSWVEFEVRDTGVGISAEDIPHLFERYWQAKKIKSIGTGLGLAICQELVKLHGGLISVESENGVGTAFRFTLPIKKDNG